MRPDADPNDILIHIGYHKTGTTWLQNEVFASHHPDFFAVSENKVGESTLAWDFVIDEEGYPLSPFVDNQAVINRKLEGILTKHTGGDRIKVLSHERLSGHPYSAGFDAGHIARRLHKTFPRAKVLMVIREQNDWLLSSYQQYLRAGGLLNISRYLKATDSGRRPEYSPTHLKYHLLIGEYQTRFGAENLLVLPYEQFRDDKPRFFEQLGNFLGRRISTDQSRFTVRFNTRQHQWVNYHLRSLSRFTERNSLTNHSLWCNRFTRNPTIWLKDTLGLLIPQSFNERALRHIRTEISEFNKGRYATSNRATEQLTDLNLGVLGYS